MGVIIPRHHHHRRRRFHHHHHYQQGALSFATTSLIIKAALAFLLLASSSSSSSSSVSVLGINPSFGSDGGGGGFTQRLSGPGSSPPLCRSKCGNCTPCKPVHVPIQPGFSLPLEYYPEAWRCKCGNKLFMP